MTEERSFRTSHKRDVSKETPAERNKTNWPMIAERYALVLVVLMLGVGFSLHPSTRDIFLSMPNLQALTLTQSVIAVSAIAATIPLITGQFDVSVGPVLGMTSVLTGVLSVKLGLSVPLAVLISVSAGGLVGAINGLVIAYVGANSFIITLATGTLLGGLVTLGTNNQIITGAPDFFLLLGTQSFVGLPWLGWILIVVALSASFALRYLVKGRHFELVGSNQSAARIVGVRVERVVMSAFIISGLLSGLAGVLLFAQTGAANPQVGAGYTLPALAAAFLGATCLRPGHFNIFGTLIGVAFVAIAVNGLTLAGVADWVQPVFNGGGLFVAVGLSSMLARKVRR